MRCDMIYILYFPNNISAIIFFSVPCLNMRKVNAYSAASLLSHPDKLVNIAELGSLACCLRAEDNIPPFIPNCILHLNDCFFYSLVTFFRRELSIEGSMKDNVLCAHVVASFA